MHGTLVDTPGRCDEAGHFDQAMVGMLGTAAPVWFCRSGSESSQSLVGHSQGRDDSSVAPSADRAATMVVLVATVVALDVRTNHAVILEQVLGWLVRVRCWFRTALRERY